MIRKILTHVIFKSGVITAHETKNEGVNHMAKVKESTVGGLDALEAAKKKYEDAKEALKELKKSTSLRGAKAAINTAYKEVLAEEDMEEGDKIVALFEAVDEIKAKFVGK